MNLRDPLGLIPSIFQNKFQYYDLSEYIFYFEYWMGIASSWMQPLLQIEIFDIIQRGVITLCIDFKQKQNNKLGIPIFLKMHFLF